MERPRVVIESRRPDAARAQAAALEHAGIEAVVCGGPEMHGETCPVLSGRPCGLMDGASAVLYDLDLETMEDRQVLRALGARHPGLPIVTERTTEELRRHAADLARCTVVVPYSADHTRDAVVAAISAVPGGSEG